jgi:hypothetical protein
VGSFERGGYGGSNGGGWNVAVAVLAEIWQFGCFLCFGGPSKNGKVSQCDIVAIQRHARFNEEWQWQGGSCVIRKRRSRRFKWYQIECGSGSIGRDMIVGGSGSGSGRVAVDSFDSERQCGHFDTQKYIVSVVWR